MFSWLRRDPDHLVQHRRRLFDALADYPVYAPPYRQGPNHAIGAQSVNDDASRKSFADFLTRGQENFAYFLRNQEGRISSLRAFLNKFEVKLDTDDAGISVASAWCPVNCGALVANLRKDSTRQEFLQMSVPWIEAQRGFNVIFDLGIFIGECVIERNRGLKWKYRPAVSHDGSTSLSGYEIEGVGNVQRRVFFDPMVRMYGICLQAENDLRLRQVGRLVKAETLARTVRDYATR
jgi:hypothetical protein